VTTLRSAAAAGESATFLRLEDVTAGYSKPCVIDLKVGLRTYSQRGHDEAYIAKRCVHDERSGQAEVGFKVCGMQTWERCDALTADCGPNDCSGSGSGSGSDDAGSVSGYLSARGDSSSAARGGGCGGDDTSGGVVMVADGVVDHGDGWLQRRRPYEWARNLCSKEHVRAALEEFVSPCPSTSSSSSSSSSSFNRRLERGVGRGGGGGDDRGTIRTGYTMGKLSDKVTAPLDAVSSDDGSFASGDENNPAAAGGGNNDNDSGAGGAFAWGGDDKKLPQTTKTTTRKSPAPSRATEVFGEALEHLRGLRGWFATQREVHLLGSSVGFT
jgi:1D-myo-inositol-tetrakisphosphate 5-kinase/inositol-polyphosphate multikinase